MYTLENVALFSSSWFITTAGNLKEALVIIQQQCHKSLEMQNNDFLVEHTEYTSIIQTYVVNLLWAPSSQFIYQLSRLILFFLYNMFRSFRPSSGK
jgi:hypothetical protein